MLEATVREAASYSAREAVEGGVADFIAEDLDDLLTQLNGREAETPSGAVELVTEGIGTRNLDKTLLENLLEFLSDPNVSFLLFSIGGLGIILELFNPGLLVPVIVGGICLILAFVGLGNLPANWAGVALILLAIVLGAAEVAVAGFGVLGVASAISLVIGGLLLFAQFGDASPTLPHIGVNRWLLFGVAAVTGGTVLYLGREAVKSRRRSRADTVQSVVGSVGVVTRDLAPRGVVRVASDTWTAVSANGERIGVGEEVCVLDIDGLVLTVTRQDFPE